MTDHIPSDIKFLQKSKRLDVTFSDGKQFSLPCALLREHSPSEEAKHSTAPINPEVNITSIEPVGNYAIKLFFDDGHNSGLFDWDLLRKLGEKQAEQ